MLMRPFCTPSSSRKLIVFAFHVGFGGLNSNRRIAAIGVRADGLAELFVERCTTHEHDIVVADALFLHRVDDDFHVGHGGRE